MSLIFKPTGYNLDNGVHFFSFLIGEYRVEIERITQAQIDKITDIILQNSVNPDLESAQKEKKIPKYKVKDFE